MVVELDGFWADVDAEKPLPFAVEVIEKSPGHRTWKRVSLRNR